MMINSFVWEDNPDQMVLDKHIDTEKLGWRTGDVFLLTEGRDKQKYLRKMNVLERFTKGIANE